MMDIKERYLGCLYGSALGDVVGSYNEFRYGDQLNFINKEILLKEQSVFGFHFGHWTDDTSMSLCTMQNYTKSNIFSTNKKDIINGMMYNFTRWTNFGMFSPNGKLFDIGNQTLSAITLWENNISYGKYEHIKMAGGNGSLMRIHPDVLFSHSRNLTDELVILSSQATHPNRTVKKFIKLFNLLLTGILNGQTKKQLSHHCHFFNWGHGRQTGYVKDSYETAVYTFFTTNSFDDGMYSIANFGDDSDTICAIYGAIAGAFYGYKALDQDLISLIKATNEFYDIDEIITPFVDTLLEDDSKKT